MWNEMLMTFVGICAIIFACSVVAAYVFDMVWEILQ